MATIVIDFPDGQAARIRDGVCGYHSFDVTGGETKAQFAKRKVAEEIKKWVKAFEQGEAAKAAAASAESGVTVT